MNRVKCVDYWNGVDRVGASVADLQRSLDRLSFFARARCPQGRLPYLRSVARPSALFLGIHCLSSGGQKQPSWCRANTGSRKRRVAPGLDSSHVKRSRVWGNPPCTSCYTVGRRVGSVAEGLRVMASRKELQYQHRQYLKSPEWQDLREQVLERDGWKCVICEFDGRLDGHHVRYPKDPYECPPYFVVALCRECHDEVHDDGAYKDNLMLKSLHLEADYLRECIEDLEDRLKDVDSKAKAILDVIIERAKEFMEENKAKETA